MRYQAIYETKFHFPGLKRRHTGKVRDIYEFENGIFAFVTSDRVSAFDVVMPRPIPYKGEILNLIAEKSMKMTTDIVPNWLIDVPDPAVSIGKKCDPFPVEMVIRGYLVGHAWREYKSGKRSICGVSLPDGMVENQKFEKPIITPTTKAEQGHDEDISRDYIIESGLVSKELYEKLENYTYKLFERGTQIAAERGLILVDTKYEFGLHNDEITLIDEVHTPDSSRYFYAVDYEKNFAEGKPQKQLSKEFLREWLMENNYMGRIGDVLPEFTDDVVEMVMNRYIELYELVTGGKFIFSDRTNLEERIKTNLFNSVESQR